MIKIVNGNILNATEDIICHQVNCMGVMGSGLAKQIRAKYPEVYTEYKKFCDKEGKDVLGSVQFVRCSNGKIVVNIFGQYKYGTDKQHTDYDALKIAFNNIYITLHTENSDTYYKTIAIPYNLGCGLAGGDWNIVYKMIKEVFNDYDVTIYKL